MGHAEPMATTILSPDGRQWRVRRRLVPRLGAETVLGRLRRRIRGTIDKTRSAGDALDVADGCLSIDLDAIAVVVIVIVAVLLAVFVVIPLLVAIVDLLILVVLGLLGILARIVLRRPWVVEASAADGERHVWRVVGWRRSGERLDHIAQMLSAGIVPPADLLTDVT